MPFRGIEQALLETVGFSKTMKTSNQKQAQCGECACTQHQPSTLLDFSIVDHPSSVPYDMPHTMEAMKHHRPRKSELDYHLYSNRPSSKRSSNNSAIEVPTGIMRDQICAPEDVETSTGYAPRDTAGDRQHPRDLRLVYAQMGRDWPMPSLLNKNFIVLQ